MTTAVFPAFYFPPISWFSCFIKEDSISSIDQFENFCKQTYRNRTCIYGANGKLALIIPMLHSSKRMMSEIQVSDAENWRSQHWKSIKSAYQNSPYFEFYEAKLKQVFESKETSLLKINLLALEVILGILKTDKTYSLTSEVVRQNLDKDFRNLFSSKKASPIQQKEYYQTFSEKHGFIEDLSIIDLICNLGPESLSYLKKLNLR